MYRKYTSDVSVDDDQLVDTNVGRGRSISIDIGDINQYKPRSIDISIDVVDLIRRYRTIQRYRSIQRYRTIRSYCSILRPKTLDCIGDWRS